MKKNVLLFVSLFIPFLNGHSSEPAQGQKKISENKSLEKNLYEELCARGLVRTEETADTGRTDGNGRHTASVSK